MAAGDLLQKRQGSFGFAYEAVPGTAEAAPVYFLSSDSARISLEPVINERVNSIGAEAIGFEQAGHDIKFTVSGAETGAEELGYLLWLMLGDVATVVSQHTTTPLYDSKYLTAFLDRGGKFDSTNDVQRGVKSRIDKITIDQPNKSFAKIAVSGMCCTKSELVAGLTPTIDLGANAAAISWNALIAGTPTINVDGGGVVNLDRMKSFKLDLTREVAAAAPGTTSNQPDDLMEGGRMVELEMVFDLRDTDSIISDLVTAEAAGAASAITFTYVTGTSSFTISIPSLIVVSDLFGDLGASADAQEVTVKFKAKQTSLSADIITIIVEDGNVALYTAR